MQTPKLFTIYSLHTFVIFANTLYIPRAQSLIQIVVFAILLIHIAFAEFYPDPPSSDNTLFITFKPE